MRVLWLIRHGRTVGDADRRYVGRTDLPMSRDGEAEIAAVRRILAGRPLDRILCSDLVRSRRTAEILAAGGAVPIEVETGLREIDMGAWEGHERAELARVDPDAWRARGADLEGFRPPDGESFGDVAERAMEVLRRLEIAPSPEHVLIAGHAGVNRVLLARLLGLPLAEIFRFAQPYGAVSRLEFSGSTPRLTLLVGPSDVP
ncbi:MAG: histidine phosphatase family protein [Phyllobacteriaceae bacterium]|nr:histidine phosphatase family protein [Phyllobacteriaceae bacterium]